MRKNSRKNNMNTAKLGVIFIVAAMALAGVSAGYAAWFDTITITGTVSTGSVDWDLEWVSGTWVYKVPDATHEIVIQHEDGLAPGVRPTPPAGFIPRDDTENCMAYAEAYEFDAATETLYIKWDNLFPGPMFCIDFLWHYVGSIPVKLSSIDVTGTGDSLCAGLIHGAIMVRADESGNIIRADGSIIAGEHPWLSPEAQIVDVCTQLHYCDYVYCIASLQVPQEDIYMDLSGQATLTITLTQWNEVECDQPCTADLAITKTASNYIPTIDDPVTYTITVTNNNGPCDATGVVVTDLLDSGLAYVSHSPPGEDYDETTGLWTIGTILNGASISLDITATVTGAGTSTSTTQLAMILDGSGSISDIEWTLMKDGLVAAINDDTIMPHDGSVELTIVQFGVGTGRTDTRVELSPTIIDGTSYSAVATIVSDMVQGNGYTPIAGGIYLATDQVYNSANFGVFDRVVVNLVTDGLPNCVSSRPFANYPNGPYPGTYVSDSYASGKASAIAARDDMIATLGMTEGVDEFDAEGVGISAAGIEWLRANIVWPQPGYDDWPPIGPGWVRSVTTFGDFADALAEKFKLVLLNIENCAEITGSDLPDLNPSNNGICIMISPRPPV